MKNAFLQCKKLLLLAIGILIVTHTYAQSTTASIEGMVADGSLPVAEALITAINETSGTSYYTFSDRGGRYHLNNVMVGKYSLSIDASGYQRHQQSGIQTFLGETTIVNVTLKLTSTMLSEVVITAEGNNSQMSVSRSGVGTHIGVEAIERIPNAANSINEVMRLMPQAAVMGNGLAVGAGSYRGSSITVDGAAFNNSFGSGSNFPAGGNPLSLEAIEQISINVTPFDVRSSGFQGGAINVVTKHGGNEWHASLYDYYKSSALCGSMVEDQEVASSQMLNNMMGFTLSGPIIKNKLFFFANAEYSHDVMAGNTRLARPNDSVDYGGNTGYNRPTTAQMEQISQLLQNKYGYNPGRYQDYSVFSPDYKLLARLDWNINTNHTFNLRLSHTRTNSCVEPSNSMSPIGGTQTSFMLNGNSYSFNRYAEGRLSDYALYFEGSRYNQVEDFTSIAAELNSTLFGGKATNLARATWSYQNEPRQSVGDLFPTVDILEPYTNANGDTNYALFTNFGVDPFSYNNLRRVNTLNFTDEVGFHLNRHNFLVGFQAEHNRITNGYMQGGAGWYLYDSWQSFATGADPLKFMITHANLDDPSQDVAACFDLNQLSVYGQDAIEVSNHFKLTAGVRLELPLISFPENGENKDFTAVANANPNSSFANLTTADRPTAVLNISPRLGFNWDVLHNRSLVLRGGTGLFTGRIPNVWLVSAATSSNYLQYTYIANGNNGQEVMPFYSTRDSIINHLHSGVLSQQDLAAPTSATILAKDLHMPTAWKSSLSADVALGYGLKSTFEAIYAYNFNEVVASTLGYTSADSILLPGEPAMRPTYTSEDVHNQSNAKMSGYYLHNNNNLHGQYLSLSAQLSKQWDCGLEIMAAYTHSFSMSLNDAGGDQVNNLAQVASVNGDNSQELGYTAHVTPNRFIASASYTLHESNQASTKIGLFYEGYNTCFVNPSFNQARYSYTMKSDKGTTIGGSQLIYIPTEEELAAMPFVNDDNRADYEAFISQDAYLSRHRGEYSKRNGAVCPWYSRVNLSIAQEFYFSRHGKLQTLTIGLDVNNVMNLIDNSKGVYQKLSSETILEYKEGIYTFTQPTLTAFNSLLSTWSAMLHLRYAF